MFLQMEYDDSKVFFLSKLVEKMQVDIPFLSSLPQISLTGCHLGTRKKYRRLVKCGKAATFAKQKVQTGSLSLTLRRLH